MKQQSLKLAEIDWQVLMGIARELGCEYRGEPSWRRLIDWIASGKLTVMDKPDKRILAFQESMRRGRWQQQEQRLKTRVERDRLRQEQKRRAAGIPPRGAQEELERAIGYRDEFGFLTESTEESP